MLIVDKHCSGVCCDEFDKLLFTTNGSNSKYSKIHNWKT